MYLCHVFVQLLPMWCHLPCDASVICNEWTCVAVEIYMCFTSIREIEGIIKKYVAPTDCPHAALC